MMEMRTVARDREGIPTCRGFPPTVEARRRPGTASPRAKINAGAALLFLAGAARRPHGGLALPSAAGPSFLDAAAFTSVRRVP